MTGELRGRIDRVCESFWSGGIANPLEAIEQITYLLFVRRLDDLPVFGPETEHLRWSRLREIESADRLYDLVADEVFPFLRRLGGAGSTYSDQMRDARLTIPTPALLAKVVDMLDGIAPENGDTSSDTNGDLYEHLLSKIASAGVNGQFRTPRHVIELMVALTAPRPDDEICDPACGTAGFLVCAAAHIRERHPGPPSGGDRRLHGWDLDSTMLRIGSMNMLMHGIEAPDIRYRDALAEGTDEAGKYTLILANPPFAGALDHERISPDLRVVRTRKTELLFLALVLKLLEPGGRAAVVVPAGMLFGSSNAHRDLRRTLVEDQRLDAVIKLPVGVFRPYAEISTAILLFTRTDSGGTDHVWFYDVRADGFTLDDRRNPVDADDLPDVLARWPARTTTERARARTEQSFTVSRAEIAAESYDLSFSRYTEIVPAEDDHRSPMEIIADLETIEEDIATSRAELKAWLR